MHSRFYNSSGLTDYRVHADCDLTTSTNATAAQVGSAVVFDCIADAGKEIRWYYCPAGCSKSVLLHNGDRLRPNVSGRISVSSTSRRSQLKINHAEVSDAGTYSCGQSHVYANQLHFLLTVYR